MDTDTRLSAPFSAGSPRLALEKGRAFFDVAKDTKRPFLVAAQGRGSHGLPIEQDGAQNLTLLPGKAARRHGSHE
jgi:transmembrane sensor